MNQYKNCSTNRSLFLRFQTYLKSKIQTRKWKKNVYEYTYKLYQIVLYVCFTLITTKDNKEFKLFERQIL